MSNIIQSSAVESALIQGDLSKLTAEQRISYYKEVCDSVRLNPLTKPFEYITLNGKLTLYAKRDATDQLRSIHKVSIKISEAKTINDVYIVIAEAKDKDGREDSSTGAVNIKGLQGDNLANAFMKAETKAKRRVTLSICGLGLLDETEVESIKDAKPFTEGQETPKSIEGAVVKAEEYVVKIGKQFKGMKLKDMKDFEIDGYAKWLSDKNKAAGTKPDALTQEFFDNASAYLENIGFYDNGHEPKSEKELATESPI